MSDRPGYGIINYSMEYTSNLKHDRNNMKKMKLALLAVISLASFNSALSISNPVAALWNTSPKDVCTKVWDHKKKAVVALGATALTTYGAYKIGFFHEPVKTMKLVKLDLDTALLKLRMCFPYDQAAINLKFQALLERFAKLC